MAEEVMLTTSDNPHNPFDAYDAWYRWDIMKGYNTLGLLALCTITSDELSEEDQSLALRAAIDEIILHNASGVHEIVRRTVPDRGI